MLFIRQLKEVISSFRPLQILGIFTLFAFFLGSLFVYTHRVYLNTLIRVPAYGGTADEGIIGSPRFINPLLAGSQSDMDMTSLVYSGLMREDAEGSFVPDLAESYSVSEDGLVYTFVIKQDAIFHDGEAVTADDVVYTVELVQDETLKSSRKIEWEGVRVTKLDESTVVFNLKQPYNQFFKSASIGILPKHIWKDVSVTNIGLSDYNLNPVGSGPYKVQNIDKKGGIPYMYHLKAFGSYSGNRPYIDSLNIHIYPNTDELIKALTNNDITQASALMSSRASAFQDSSRLAILTEPLPRIYGVFFNQSKNSALVSKNVRRALSMSIDRNQVITEALYGYGVPAYSPVPKILQTENEEASIYSIEKSLEILKEDGFVKNESNGILEKKTAGGVVPFSFTISTLGDVTEFKKTAETLKSNWEKVGAKVDIAYYENGDLTQKIIKARNYDILLYGVEAESYSDLYAYWHSSQIKDPGLNLSGYANTKVDEALLKMRNSKSIQDNEGIQKVFTTEINNDLPAIFIYSPEFIYISNKKIEGISLGGVVSPEDRFKNISGWYIKTEYIWKGLERIEILKELQNKIHNI